MTALMAPPPYRTPYQRRKMRRRLTAIPKGFPENLNLGSIVETFERHPWLEDSPVGALAQSVRDAVISA